MINDSAVDAWRLGSPDEPGWFDISGCEKLETKWAMITLFRLDWTDFDLQQDAFINMLHSITIGSQTRKSKIHLENFAQILHGGLHITSRFCDHSGIHHRHTRPMPGNPYDFLGRWMVLCYTGRVVGSRLITCSILYDYESRRRLQRNYYTYQPFEQNHTTFGYMPKDRIICAPETMNIPSDHVNVGGRTLQKKNRGFCVQRIWACLGQTFYQTSPDNMSALFQTPWPETIADCRAWYCCDVAERCDTDPAYAVCHGLYHHPQDLGLDLAWPKTCLDSVLRT
jgi:hypothetical protein